MASGKPCGAKNPFQVETAKPGRWLSDAVKTAEVMLALERVATARPLRLSALIWETAPLSDMQLDTAWPPRRSLMAKRSAAIGAAHYAVPLRQCRSVHKVWVADAMPIWASDRPSGSVRSADLGQLTACCGSRSGRLTGLSWCQKIFTFQPETSSRIWEIEALSS